MGPYTPPSYVSQPVPAHPITPVAGSAYSLDGSPANLMQPLSYPVEALCALCGTPVRCDRWLALTPGDDGEWYHISAFTLGGR